VVRVYWKALVWNLIILILSLMPSDGIPGSKWWQFPHIDKVVHFIMYALLTILILQKNHILFGKFKQINVLGVTFFYVFFMGFFIEILQNSFLIGRNFDIFDVVANTIASVSVLLSFRIYHHLNK
jgi:VanZ family protein